MMANKIKLYSTVGFDLEGLVVPSADHFAGVVLSLLDVPVGEGLDVWVEVFLS